MSGNAQTDSTENGSVSSTFYSDDDSANQEFESTDRTTICLYPGCDRVIVHERTYWGQDQKFCGREHRERTFLLIVRLKRLYKITGCPFLESVLAYFQAVVAGRPP